MRQWWNPDHRSRVAILVLTADFLASKYITEAELPVLLEAADADGATILCVYGSQVHLTGLSKRLSKYQFVNSPEQPLQVLSEAGRSILISPLFHITHPGEGLCLKGSSRFWFNRHSRTSALNTVERFLTGIYAGQGTF